MKITILPQTTSCLSLKFLASEIMTLLQQMILAEKEFELITNLIGIKKSLSIVVFNTMFTSAIRHQFHTLRHSIKKAVSKFMFIAKVGMLKRVTNIIEILILITLMHASVKSMKQTNNKKLDPTLSFFYTAMLFISEIDFLPSMRRDVFNETKLLAW